MNAANQLHHLDILFVSTHKNTHDEFHSRRLVLLPNHNTLPCLGSELRMLSYHLGYSTDGTHHTRSHQTWSFTKRHHNAFSSILTCVLWNYSPITTFLWAWFVLILVLWTHNMHFCNLITTHFFTIEVAKTPGSRLVQNLKMGGVRVGDRVGVFFAPYKILAF